MEFGPVLGDVVQLPGSCRAVPPGGSLAAGPAIAFQPPA